VTACRQTSQILAKQQIHVAEICFVASAPFSLSRKCVRAYALFPQHTHMIEKEKSNTLYVHYTGAALGTLKKGAASV
jgi:hypothetical protein